MIKILIVGISGRMGLEIVKSVKRRSESGESIEVVGGIAAPDSELISSVLEGVREPISAVWNESFSDANLIIDFSSASGTTLALKIAEENNLPILIGTTGLDESQEKEIASLATSLPILRTRNTSVGVNTMAILLEKAASMLGKEFEVELVELHHRYKTDSPSGTALMLLEHVALGNKSDLSENLLNGRAGTNLKRAEGEIGAHAVRGGDVAGEHTVYFFGEGERIEITHRATDRKIFADGAVRGAVWLSDQKPSKLFSMLDALNNCDLES